MSAGILFFMLSVEATAEVVEPQEVDARAVKLMMDEDDALVIFPLSSIEFNDLHIKGAVNIPISLLNSRLPEDKTRKLVFYCLGADCSASRRAAEKAIDLGYRNVYAFREGLPGWIEAGYPTETFEKIPELKIDKISTSALALQLDTGKVTLVDINQDEVGHKFYVDHPCRVHITMDEMPLKLSQLDNDQTIVVMCFKGNRAVVAARYLINKGFTRVLAVDGGLQKWVLEGRPYKQES